MKGAAKLKMIKLLIKVTLLILMIIVPTASPVFAEQITIKDVEYFPAVQYPSTVPVYLVRVIYDPGEKNDEEVREFFEQARWKVTIEQKSEPHQVEDVVMKIQLNPANTVVYLFLDPGSVKKGDKITMLAKDSDVPIPIKNPKTIETPETIFTVDPKQVSDQELTDGTKKDVYQFGVKLHIPSIPLFQKFAQVYINSDNLLSTEKTDKNTKIDFKLGAEWGLSKEWYWPVFIEAKYLANQSFDNTSAVATAGTKLILPWRWSQPALWSNFIKAPISPYFTIGVQYQNHLKKDPLVATSHAEDKLYRYNGQIEWKPIHLFPGKGYSPKDITLEIKAECWYFPDDKATGGAIVRRFERHFNSAIFMPINAPEAFEASRKDESAITRLKLEYDTGANEANGFVRASSVKFGFEILY